MELTRINRPLVFNDCIGNTEVKNTIKNSVKDKALFPKIILAGQPGVGKTSLAMVIALASQCEHPVDGVPCLQCDTCKEIMERLIRNGESCCNIHFFNMADMKNLADARMIMDLLSYKKSKKYPYTIFILEEPQNMSVDAQDLLNKPLEVLQPHIKIIFTTTSLPSISDAIQSRSHVYTLKAPSMQETTDLLQNICIRNLNAEIPRPLLTLITEYSNNVPRNAINNLELVMQTGNISVKSINEVLGLIDFELYIEFFSIVHKDITQVAEFISSLKDRSCSYVQFVKNLHIFMTDVFKMKFGITITRYTKKQYTQCRNLFGEFSYAEFTRLQILSTQLITNGLNNDYFNERFAESQLFQFALQVNQNMDLVSKFKDTSNDHAHAVRAYQERQIEESRQSTAQQITNVNDILAELGRNTNEEQSKKIEVVRGTKEINRTTADNIVYD